MTRRKSVVAWKHSLTITQVLVILTLKCVHSQMMEIPWMHGNPGRRKTTTLLFDFVKYVLTKPKFKLKVEAEKLPPKYRKLHSTSEGRLFVEIKKEMSVDIEVKAEMKSYCNTHFKTVTKTVDKDGRNELMLRDKNESSKVSDLNSLGCG